MQHDRVRVLALFHRGDGEWKAFEAFEQAILPLLAEFGATLDEAVRDRGETLEAHLLTFPSRSAFEQFLSDRRRAALEAQRPEGLTTQILEVETVHGYFR